MKVKTCHTDKFLEGHVPLSFFKHLVTRGLCVITSSARAGHHAAPLQGDLTGVIRQALEGRERAQTKAQTLV